jgi:hypothetical protein
MYGWRAVPPFQGWNGAPFAARSERAFRQDERPREPVPFLMFMLRQHSMEDDGQFRAPFGLMEPRRVGKGGRGLQSVGTASVPPCPRGLRPTPLFMAKTQRVGTSEEVPCLDRFVGADFAHPTADFIRTGFAVSRQPSVADLKYWCGG